MCQDQGKDYPAIFRGANHRLQSMHSGKSHDCWQCLDGSLGWDGRLSSTSCLFNPETNMNLVIELEVLSLEDYSDTTPVQLETDISIDDCELILSVAKTSKNRGATNLLYRSGRLQLPVSHGIPMNWLPDS